MTNIAGCTGKQAYRSAHLAWKVMKRWIKSKRHRQKFDHQVQAYRCKSCGLYHLGGVR